MGRDFPCPSSKVVEIRSTKWARDGAATPLSARRRNDVEHITLYSRAVAKRRRPWGHRRVMGQHGQCPGSHAECSLTFTPANEFFESSVLWELVHEVRVQREETSSCLNPHRLCFTVAPTRNRCVSESWGRLSNRLRDATDSCSRRAVALLRGNIDALWIRHTVEPGVTTSSSSTLSG